MSQREVLREVLFEGFSEQEILGLPHEHVDKLILLGEPLVFRGGSAELLGSFKIASDHLVVELAQIEGGRRGRSNLTRYIGEAIRDAPETFRGGVDNPCRDMRQAQSEAPPRARTQRFHREECRRSR